MKHRQVTASRASVDEGLVDLLEAIWLAGIDTQFSCQGGPDENDWPHTGYILFPTINNAVRFLETTAGRTDHEDYGHLALGVVPTRSPGGPVRAKVQWPHELTLILTAAWTNPPCTCGHPFSEHFWRCQCGSTEFSRVSYAPGIYESVECRECDALRAEWPTCCNQQPCLCDGFTTQFLRIRSISPITQHHVAT
jgi:hypothetical protein